MALSDTIDGSRAQAHRPWPRVVVGEAGWRAMATELSAGRLTLLGLWGEPRTAHMAVLDDEAAEIAVVTIECPQGSFPSVGALHPPAIRLERALHDLYGLIPEGLPDTRPWLDHGVWGVRRPLGAYEDRDQKPPPYAFLPAEGESLHQIPVGPVHAGIIEPGHFRFTANGETVVRLEERLGYVHKGVESLMTGAPLDKAARLAARVSGDSTVAYGLAFARAVEVALDIEAPPRAIWLRALMAELERLANHLGDIGAICNDAAFALMHAQCGILRERVLRAAHACFGHRMMMDRIAPGGVSCDLPAEGAATLRVLLDELRRVFPRLVNLYDNTASLQDRTAATGVLRAELALRFGAGGFIGRASGRAFDARKRPGYPPYDQLDFDLVRFEAGDVSARVWVRIREVEQSLNLVEQIVRRMPAGPVKIEAGGEGRNAEGMALVEGFRGDVLAWLRIDNDRIARCCLRDPSWFQWPLLEAVIEGNIVADFPLCNKSFNCSYSGHDL